LGNNDAWASGNSVSDGRAGRKWSCARIEWDEYKIKEMLCRKQKMGIVD